VFAADGFPTMNELVIWPDWFGQDWYAFNKVSFLTFLAMLIPVILFVTAGAKYKKRVVPRGVQTVVEATVEMVERQVILPTMGAEGMVYLPLLISIFVFILVGNLFGIIPPAFFSPNARMGNPVVLALMVWLVFIGVGLKHHGLKYFLDAINPPGVPMALKPLVMFIELFSVFVLRPFSLAIRLFANLLAGHILLVTFVVLTVSVWELSGLASIVPVTFLGLLLFTGFELLVAVLQAYVFTLLTAVYIGSSIHAH
jgi:F-type H+-transporting ATPase subunit a